MTKRYPGDGGPTWNEDLGGDGITRRIMRHYGPDEGDLALRDKLRAFAPGFFRRRLEDMMAHCDEVLAKHDWLKERNAKRLFPGDRDCQPYSDLWYAGLIGQLCWQALNYEEFSSGEAGLEQAMSIGIYYTEWEWRTFRSHILRGSKTLKASQRGGASSRGAFAEPTQRVLIEMRRLRAEGHTVSGAAEAAARRGIGASAGANRATWYRSKPKKL